MDWPGCDGCRAFWRLFNVDDPDYHLAGCAVREGGLGHSGLAGSHDLYGR